MIPSVDTPEAAEAAVSACHYPPRSTRGAAHLLNRASSDALLLRYAALGNRLKTDPDVGPTACKINSRRPAGISVALHGF